MEINLTPKLLNPYPTNSNIFNQSLSFVFEFIIVIDHAQILKCYSLLTAYITWSLKIISILR